MSAPVFDHFGRIDLLNEELAHALDHGLSSKTIIHPCQIGPTHAAFQLVKADCDEACALGACDARAVYSVDRRMIESATHRAWALAILACAEAFGIRPNESAIALER